MVFTQIYQVCVFFKEIFRFKIWEYEVSWSRDGGLQAPVGDGARGSYKTNLKLIGLKELIGEYYPDKEIQYNFVPMLDQNY